ncbi:cell division protein ZapA [Oceanibacterium hippocampi]|uniref:Cell division protein ZapA n=1 Tax=Oceanibacterium hippocampi TaxID=745714 RepID=A0A1Y5TUQ6_9PROT|nr:cell division protein ZapA [Oceanibacterium hippocampi]SLN73437.1 Cell division protein ZapA [Oceanibacterium hippocampi]
MARVTVSINNRSYTLGCDDGEEEHVSYLARYLDERVTSLARGVGNVGEAQLLLMAALLVSDDLADAYEELEKSRANDPDPITAEPFDAALIDDVARRIDAIAARLERA